MQEQHASKTCKTGNGLGGQQTHVASRASSVGAVRKSPQAGEGWGRAASARVTRPRNPWRSRGRCWHAPCHGVSCHESAPPQPATHVSAMATSALRSGGARTASVIASQCTCD
jgi:hypothetical protein